MSILIKGMDMPTKDEMLGLNIYPDGRVTYQYDLRCNRIATAVSVPPQTASKRIEEYYGDEEEEEEEDERTVSTAL